MNVTVDSTLNISCNIDSRPPAEITWLYNGNIPNSGVTHPRHDGSSQFVIQSVSYDDDGEYRCQAWNSVSNEVRFSGIATVKVRGKTVTMLTDSQEFCFLIVNMRLIVVRGTSMLCVVEPRKWQ